MLGPTPNDVVLHLSPGVRGSVRAFMGTRTAIMLSGGSNRVCNAACLHPRDAEIASLGEEVTEKRPSPSNLGKDKNWSSYRSLKGVGIHWSADVMAGALVAIWKLKEEAKCL